MNTPVEHRPASSGTSADPDPPASRQEGSALAESGRSTRSAVPAQPSRQAVPAEQRGRTDISCRVVSRIAARAAGEVARVREVGERKALSFRGGTRATLDGELTTLRLDVTVEYPAPIREVAEEVRHHVAQRVMALTGKDVGYIDILVTNVTPAHGDHGDHGISRAAGATTAGGDPAGGAGRTGAGTPDRTTEPVGDPADNPTEDIVPLREER